MEGDISKAIIPERTEKRPPVARKTIGNTCHLPPLRRPCLEREEIKSSGREREALHNYEDKLRRSLFTRGDMSAGRTEIETVLIAESISGTRGRHGIRLLSFISIRAMPCRPPITYAGFMAPLEESLSDSRFVRKAT
ncbi:hypothetical protein AVEN_151645-1 [Araneus ventricosus]|uniref:Uncharacterized protein n=1 Tax=Araneus ventricosus TaxID=182803 RepID=A0A4Y2RHN5_ARAVE|nr:hypothetical protein AVEN_151645-1 [Araneus ventricosus]